jgi:hypothetical protein
MLKAMDAGWNDVEKSVTEEIVIPSANGRVLMLIV